MVRRVCLVSGGTGGHLMPALVLARALRERGHEPVLLTEGREVERDMVQRELPDVSSRPLPGATAGQRPSRLGLPWWLARTTLAARRALREERIDCVVSTGGRPSVPVGLAARSLGLPLFLLEQNAVTGRANRCLAPFARRIYRGLPDSVRSASGDSVAGDSGSPEPKSAASKSAGRGLVTGTPLRGEVGHVDRVQARRELDLSVEDLVVLVVGGSQGARALNEAVPEALGRAAVDCHVIHLAGAANEDAVRAQYHGLATTVEARVHGSRSDMARLYAAADLVICRGGGTTVAELMAVGRAAVIVPYPHHRDQQQLHNANVLVRAEAAVVVEQRELTAEWLANILRSLLGSPERLAAMGRAAHAVEPGDATAAILADLERCNGWTESDA
ncbi:MAG: UDP-N-acetylglucosamine--N-acetylmuramyl-(pentapeptide) pyrophosphoryl-undecaprenol N-acetylglucosamine transferase [bacterium]|nr:UDP-N-acetylglucosamine--N-acetylmuramyl-(pentapeptide) pyrophosphoryl-undecaprenol N-acetylglucosamine transferase [bacterium]